MSTTAPCSTLLFEFMSFGYGNPIHRLSAVGVRICSGVYAFCVQAFGLCAATSLNRDQSSEMWTRCSSMDRPAAARRACSNIG